MYFPIPWQDQVNDAETGEEIQAGTPLSAGNLNQMAEGIMDNNIAINMMVPIVTSMLKNQTSEIHEVTLKNNASFPFNNSAQAIALDVVRSSNDYEVFAECKNDDGWTGDIIIYDKLINGFKVKFTGSAKTADIVLKVKGGY